jgi:hypothetical protein
MSTLLIAGSPGQSLEYIDTHGISAGSGMQTSAVVELQVNQATTAVNDGTTTRQIQREEVLVLLNLFQQEIISNLNWPYASS